MEFAMPESRKLIAAGWPGSEPADIFLFTCTAELPLHIVAVLHGQTMKQSGQFKEIASPKRSPARCNRNYGIDRHHVRPTGRQGC